MKNYFVTTFLIFPLLILCQTESKQINVGVSNSNQLELKEKSSQDTIILIQEGKSIKSEKIIPQNRNATKNLEKTNATPTNEMESKKSQVSSATFVSTKKASNTQSSRRSPTAFQQKQMIELVNDFEQSAPSSFEYHYFKYLAGNYDVNLKKHLFEAQKLQPKNEEVYVQLAAYNFIKNDDKNLKENLEFLLKSKKIDEELLIYASDLLASVSKNGILMTHGFDDTYAALYVQKNLKKRTDVKIISLDFLQSEYYRTSLQSENLILPSNTIIDVNYLKAFCENNKNKSLHLSLTFPKPYLSEISDKLAIYGLTFLYTETTKNLFTENKEIFKSLNSNKISSLSSEKLKKLSSNYLPFLLSLKSEYDSLDDKTSVNEINTLINNIKQQAKK